MFLHWAFLVSRFDAKYFSKIYNICKVFFNICKYFFNICKVFCQNLLLTLMFLHWAFLVSRFNAKYFSKKFKVFFNICKVFFQQLQSIFSTFAKYSFSKFASIINVFPLGFYRVRVQCKVFFLICFKTRRIGEIYIFWSFSKTKRRKEIGPKSQPICLQILRRQCCLK